MRAPGRRCHGTRIETATGRERRSTMRTMEQLKERIALMKKRDGFGMAIADLLVYDPDELKPEHRDEAKKLEDAQVDAERQLREYLPFAFDKALGHRGLSAGRSVMHVQNWLWLMERDDLLDFAESDDNYACYGVPILKHVAGALGVELPRGIWEWRNGEPCVPGCDDGCLS
jgi:hypothetical protein